jgi:3-hydroxymyristoyl/3-hydroxydecanoyl-(acyl carrier protein) dehydratase
LGRLPAEGAAAVMLKRLSDAQAQGDTIYAILEGVGLATAQNISPETVSAAYESSLRQALETTGIGHSELILYETPFGKLDSLEPFDKMMLTSLANAKTNGTVLPLVCSYAPSALGHAGAAMDMLALVTTVCCLYHRTLPAELTRGSHHSSQALQDTYWCAADVNAWQSPLAKKCALVGALSADGQAAHAILRAHHTQPWTGEDRMSGPDETAQPKDEAWVKRLGGAPLFPPPPKGIRSIASAPKPAQPPISENGPPSLQSLQQLLQTATETMSETSVLHERYLDLSSDIVDTYTHGLKIRGDLHARLQARGISMPPSASAAHDTQKASAETPTKADEPLFSREQCLAFATASVTEVLGPDFSPVDRYPARVRLPDEPLMLVDRILTIEGERRALRNGRIVTEHDVLPKAWYLDGGRVPVCIAVEAGQADLFLIAYLGIDFKVKGQRTYRLLDATVTFHAPLPQPGDTLRYDIRIDKFIRQQETYLFFFSFIGTIGDQLLITMTDGCAGFFTPREVARSGGVVLTEEGLAPAPGRAEGHWEPLVSCQARERYNEQQLDALRQGDLATCFGRGFDGIEMADQLRLPGGRMRLIDRVLELDPTGGRYGLGQIRAEADIHPDDWFLVCHFVDDMVMPGTLMYECCAHTLRVLLQRMGWISDQSGASYQPVVGVASKLICRGPVTPDTAKVVYEIQIRKIGYRPEPFVIGDAYMYADGHRIVMFEDISMRLSSVDLGALRALWRSQPAQLPESLTLENSDQATRSTPLFDRSSLVAFAQGKPSDAFGTPYAPFDGERFIARLPREPFLMIDRIVRAEPEAWRLQPDGWVTAETDVDPTDWHFHAEGTGFMAYSILLEIALQPCGWLAAYMGSALRSDKALYFRNLGGEAKLSNNIAANRGTLTTRCRLTRISEAADMIIETFQFEVLQAGRRVFHGDTYFGFFTAQALAQQTGISGAVAKKLGLTNDPTQGASSVSLALQAPLTPADRRPVSLTGRACLPGGALLMIDRIENFETDGGPHGLGFVHATKQIKVDEWFFGAHFLDDPVWPGSLGIEAFMQLLKYYMLSYWKDIDNMTFTIVEGESHRWTYRGQVIPSNKQVDVTAVITQRLQTPKPTLLADGWLGVDGTPIYEMKNFGLCLAKA